MIVRAWRNSSVMAARTERHSAALARSTRRLALVLREARTVCLGSRFPVAF